MKYLSIKTSDDTIKIPYLILKGNKKGKTCVISGGMHGDEVNGIALVKKFIEYCKKNEIEKTLTGTIIVIPILNQSGFEKKKRHVSPDNKDLNRSFNKKEKSTSNLIANALEKHLYSKADFVIDCHDAGKRSILLPHSRVQSAEENFCKKCTKEMAMAFGSKIIIERPGKKGMLAIEIGKKYNTPVLTIEIGGALRLFPKFLEKGLEGILNILTHYNFLSLKTIVPKTQYYLKDRYGIPAPETGILTFDKKLGQRVHVGDEIGKLYIPYKNKTVKLFAQMCGVIFSKQYLNTAAKGELIYSILEDRECHLKKRKTLDMFTEIKNIKM